MNKKFVAISAVIVVMLAASGLYLGRILKARQDALIAVSETPTQAPVELETWKDQSEFEFNYPKNLKLDPHPEDTENYAHVELTSNAFPGSIILWTKDTKYQTVDDYIKGEKIENQIGSTLGELPAAKILDSSDANKFTLLTVRNGYLYQIDADTKGEKIWNDVFAAVVDSYKFTAAEEEKIPAVNNAVPPASSEEVYTEEEVIE